MQVHHCLAGGLAIVDANVVASRSEIIVQGFLCLVHCLQNGCLLDGLEYKEGLNVTFGDDEGVAFRDGVSVTNGDGVVGFGDDPVNFEITEDAIVFHA